MARWAYRRRAPAVLMSETQAIDAPRIWWKEAVKRRRVALFGAGLVGGSEHADYLVDLGMPRERIAFGYNAVDHDWYVERSDEARLRATAIGTAHESAHFLAVGRFVPEKNFVRLIEAFAAYRRDATDHVPWTLVLCGDGPDAPRIERAIRATGLESAIERPGFLQAEQLVDQYARAAAFVLPSLVEAWGLVTNEAAACGLPLLVSDRAGCASTLVPEPGSTGWRFDPTDTLELARLLGRVARSSKEQRLEIGGRARAVAARWGPGRFAAGMLEAIEHAGLARKPRIADMEVSA